MSSLEGYNGLELAIRGQFVWVIDTSRKLPAALAIASRFGRQQGSVGLSEKSGRRSDGEWIDNKTRAVAARLDELYGPRPWRSHGSPLDELVGTILSQHTSDINTARAFASLTSSFDGWNDVRTAPVEMIEQAIRSGGLARIKAERIKNILNEIFLEHGHVNLDHLDAMTLADSRQWLLGLHGVGPKTAACVMLFSLGKPALPVDTHVHRVARRIGLIGPKVSADAAHTILENALGENRDRVYAFHMNVIAHGRTVCKARVPLCEQCGLFNLCDYVTARGPDA